jgi:hypothetical protein
MNPGGPSQESRIFCVLVALMIWCCGCQATEAPGAADRGLDLRGMRQPTGPLIAAEVLPEHPSIREYRITAGPATGGTILQSVEQTREYGAQWALNTGGARIEYWGIDDTGNLILPVIFDYEDRTITVFDPPMVLVYESMTAGEQQREQVDMFVLDSRNPDRVVRSGIATRTIEYIDDQIISTPAGEYRAHRLAVHFHALLGTSEIERTSTFFVAPGIGLIAEESNEKLQIVNVIDREQTQTIVLSRLQFVHGQQR